MLCASSFCFCPLSALTLPLPARPFSPTPALPLLPPCVPLKQPPYLPTTQRFHPCVHLDPPWWLRVPITKAGTSSLQPHVQQCPQQPPVTGSQTAAIGCFSLPALLPTPALSTQLPTLAIPATPLTGPSPHARPRLKASRASSHLIFSTST